MLAESAQQPAPDQHGVLARRAVRPQQARARRRGGERAQRAEHARRAAALQRRQEGMRGALVQLSALCVQSQERLAVARQRATERPGRGLRGAADALPRPLGLDVQQHDHVRLERRANARGEDAAAAQRDHVPRPRAVQQLAHQLLLGGAKRRLAVSLELLAQVSGRAARSAAGRCRARSTPSASAELGRYGRLARAHEADQHERASRRALYACHPIRSR